MTLELHKLTTQVEQMGQALANQQEDIEGKTVIALQILEAYADAAYLPYILQRVQDAVDRDAGYRGARPIDPAPARPARKGFFGRLFGASARPLSQEASAASGSRKASSAKARRCQPETKRASSARALSRWPTHSA